MCHVLKRRSAPNVNLNDRAAHSYERGEIFRRIHLSSLERRNKKEEDQGDQENAKITQASDECQSEFALCTTTLLRLLRLQLRPVQLRCLVKKFAGIEVFHEIVDYSCLIYALNLHFTKKALTGKTCSWLLKPQKVAPNAKSCSKVAKHN